MCFKSISLTTFTLCVMLLAVGIPNCASAQKPQKISLSNDASSDIFYTTSFIKFYDFNTSSDTYTRFILDKEKYPYQKFAKLIIQNNSPRKREVCINWGILAKITMYQTSSSDRDLQKTGFAVPHAEKSITSPVITKNYSKHTLLPHGSIELSLYLEDIQVLPDILEIHVSDSHHWRNDFVLHRFLQGLFLGFMSVFILLSLVLYLSNFVLAYFYLFLYILGMFMRFLAFYGFLDGLTLTQTEDYFIWISFSQIGAIFFILFIRDVLLIKTTHQTFNYLLLFLILSRFFVFLVITALYFSSYSVDLLGKIIGFLDLFTLPLALWVLAYFSKKGLFARYLLLSTMCLLLGLLLGVISRFDVFYLPGGMYSFQIGITGQLLFICLGMGVQIKNQIKKERKSQDQVLVLQKEINTRLELKVEERTEALQKAYQEITFQNQELHKREKEYLHINDHLGTLVEIRTAEIVKQNELLRNYAYFNAHKVRGPLARILGLIYLIRLEPTISEDDFSLFIQRLSLCANELDKTIKEINQILSDDDEEEDDENHT